MVVGSLVGDAASNQRTVPVDNDMVETGQSQLNFSNSPKVDRSETLLVSSDESDDDSVSDEGSASSASE